MTTWQLYFATLAAWTLHPGYTRPGSKPPSLNDCANLATLMLKLTEEHEQWPPYPEQ